MEIEETKKTNKLAIFCFLITTGIRVRFSKCYSYFLSSVFNSLFWDIVYPNPGLKLLRESKHKYLNLIRSFKIRHKLTN